MTEPTSKLSRRLILLLVLLGACVAALWFGQSEPVPRRPSRPASTARATGARDIPPAVVAPQGRIRLLKVATGLRQPTDIQSPPGHPGKVVILQKQGTARIVQLESGSHRRWFSLPVRSRSEQGLLGLAFHPKFETNGRFFVHHTPKEGEHFLGRITAWRCDPTTLAEPRLEHTILEVQQPYANHNGGALAFGPKGHLFIGFGDGGSADDPHGHGQDGQSLLGSILRIDVDSTEKDYLVQPDSPFHGIEQVHDAIFARGLRNPWRFSFTPDGRLVVADVGQNSWEELDLVPAGANMGWNVREGRHCFDAPTCAKKSALHADFTEPVWEYGRELGGSITGGYVYTGPTLPELHGRYIVADFLSGRIWALRLPDKAGKPASEVQLLGKFGINPVTFGRLPDGELLLADFTTGALFRLAPTATP